MLESSTKSVNKAILMFVEAESWVECKQVVETQRHLLFNDAADQILVEWIEQSEDNPQAAHVFREYRNLLARCRKEGIEVAFADRIRPSQEVYDAVLAFVQTENWVKCKELIVKKPDLLLNEGANQVLLSWLKQSQQDPHAMRVFHEYRELLLRCRKEGVEAAFTKRVRPPKAVFDAITLLLAVKDEDAAKTVLAENSALLLNPAADEVFALWLKKAQNKPRTIKLLKTYRAWLADQRSNPETLALLGSFSAQALSQAVQTFVQAKNWEESKQIVVANQDLLLSDMADHVFVILLKQAINKPDTIRQLQHYRDVLQTCRREGIEAAFAATQSAPRTLSAIIQAFIDANSWQESKQIVEAESDLLLSDEADEALAALIEEHQGNQKALRTYQEHRQLLRRCREEGIDVTFTQPLQKLQNLSEKLLCFVDAADQKERKRIVEQHHDLLLTGSTENLFTVLIKQAKKDPDRVKKLQCYRRLLNMCRTDGIEQAFRHPIALFEVSSNLRARLMAVKSSEEFEELIASHSELLSILEELKPSASQTSLEQAPSTTEMLPNEELAKTLFTFVAAQSWPESKAYLEQHPELLSTEADHMLIELLAQKRIPEEEQHTLQEHRQLLAHARYRGIQSAFANLAPVPRHVIPSLRKYLNAQGIHERKKIVKAERDLLLSEAADQVLSDLQTEYRANSKAYAILARRRALLAQARNKGIEAAFATYHTPVPKKVVKKQANKAAKTVEQRRNKRVDQISPQVGEKAASRVVKKPVTKVVKKPVKKIEKKAANQIAKKPAKRATNQAANQVVKKPNDKPADSARSTHSNERARDFRGMPGAEYGAKSEEAKENTAPPTQDFWLDDDVAPSKTNNNHNDNQFGDFSGFDDPASSPLKQEVYQAVMLLLQADTLIDSQQLIEEQQALLLTDEAERIFANMIAQSQHDPHALARLQQQQQLLTRARRDNIERDIEKDINENNAKLDEDTVLDAVLLFIEAKSWSDSKRAVEQHGSILLTDAAEQMLENLFAQYKHDTEIADMLVKHRNLLRRIRSDGIDTAFAKQTNTSTSQDIPEEFMLELQAATAARERLKSDNSPSALNAAVDAWQDLLNQPTIQQYTKFKVDVQSELGGVLLRRYWELEQANDLNAAIQAYQQVLEVTPRRAPSLPGRLNNLGLALRARFALHRHQRDVNAAIMAYRKALRRIPPDANERPSILNNLGVALTDRYSTTSIPEDLNAAIVTYEEALKLLPKEAANRTAIEENLKLALQDRFKYINGLKK